jgi:hypothetical protein
MFIIYRSFKEVQFCLFGISCVKFIHASAFMRGREDKAPLILYVGAWRTWAVSFMFALLKQRNSLWYPWGRRLSWQQSRTPSLDAVSLERETKFHTRTKQWVQLRTLALCFSIGDGTTSFCILSRMVTRIQVLASLGCGAASFVDFCPTFRDDVLASCSRVEVPAANSIVSINLSVTVVTNVAAEWLVFLFHILAFLVSNLGSYIACPNGGSACSLSVLPNKFRDIILS